MAGSKDVAATLVRATRRSGRNKMLDLQYWTEEEAQRCLRRIDDTVSVQFAAGSIAKANHDKDVAERVYVIGVFMRYNNISVVLIPRVELEKFGQEGSGLIAGDGQSLREMNELYEAVQLKKCTGSTKLYT